MKAWPRAAPCFLGGMNFWLMVIAVQMVVTIFALIRDRGEDSRFVADKVGYRS